MATVVAEGGSTELPASLEKARRLRRVAGLDSFKLAILGKKEHRVVGLSSDSEDSSPRGSMGLREDDESELGKDGRAMRGSMGESPSAATDPSSKEERESLRRWLYLLFGRRSISVLDSRDWPSWVGMPEAGLWGTIPQARNPEQTQEPRGTPWTVKSSHKEIICQLRPGMAMQNEKLGHSLGKNQLERVPQKLVPSVTGVSLITVVITHKSTGCTGRGLPHPEKTTRSATTLGQ